MKTVEVVGAVITNGVDEILCAKRSKQMGMGNMWEFPGGKIDHGEDAKAALIREIKEELDCTIFVDQLIESTTYSNENMSILLHTYSAKIIEGVPKALEHEELRWMKKAHLYKLTWAPADLPTVEKLIKESS